MESIKGEEELKQYVAPIGMIVFVKDVNLPMMAKTPAALDAQKHNQPLTYAYQKNKKTLNFGWEFFVAISTLCVIIVTIL